MLNLLPGVDIHSGLTEREAAIVTELRLPRVVLGLLVGAMLALAGGCYQGVFRNPLADPYLLGVAAGAGLGGDRGRSRCAARATSGAGTSRLPVGTPVAAFAGALIAVALLPGSGRGRRRDRTTGDADPRRRRRVGVPHRRCRRTSCSATSTTIREVYSWLLGRLATNGWHEVLLLLPYAVVTAVVVLAAAPRARRALGRRRRGERASACIPQRSRLHPDRGGLARHRRGGGSVSGLIGFVGIIVPHIVRLLAGTSATASILPLSMLFGGAFLALADLVARTVAAPAEIPIGVVTAFVGAPFFVLVLRTARGG